jgi:hypothetical protein
MDRATRPPESGLYVMDARGAEVRGAHTSKTREAWGSLGRGGAKVGQLIADSAGNPAVRFLPCRSRLGLLEKFLLRNHFSIPDSKLLPA